MALGEYGSAAQGGDVEQLAHRRETLTALADFIDSSAAYSKSTVDYLATFSSQTPDERRFVSDDALNAYRLEAKLSEFVINRMLTDLGGLKVNVHDDDPGQMGVVTGCSFSPALSLWRISYSLGRRPLAGMEKSVTTSKLSDSIRQSIENEPLL